MQTLLKYMLVLTLVSATSVASAHMMGNGTMGAGMGMMNEGQPSGPVTDSNQSQGKGAAAFQQVCSACHGLPDPRQHTASQWPRVVHRMEYHMSSYGMPLPDSETIQAINHYLESHADGQ